MGPEFKQNRSSRLVMQEPDLIINGWLQFFAFGTEYFISFLIRSLSTLPLDFTISQKWIYQMAMESVVRDNYYRSPTPHTNTILR
jgi:hypothetical protein